MSSGYEAPSILPSSSTCSTSTAAALALRITASSEGSAVAAAAAAAASTSSTANNGSRSAEQDADGLLWHHSSTLSWERFLHQWIPWFFSGAAVTLFVISLIAMYLAQSTLVYVAFSIPLFITAPWTLWQTWFQLRGLSPQWLLRRIIKDAKNQIRQMHHWNGLFHKEVTRLQAEQQQLSSMKDELEQSKMTDVEMGQMKAAIREHGFVQRRMKRLLAAQELQKVLSVLLNSSAKNSATASSSNPQQQQQQQPAYYNNDYQFTDRDIERLLVRLQATLNVADRDRLRAAFHNASTRSFKRLYLAAENMQRSKLLDIGGTCNPGGPCHDETAFDFLQWRDD